MGIAGEIHLGDQPRRAAADRDMDMGRAPAVDVRPRQIGARHDGAEAIAAGLVGHRPAEAEEVRVEPLAHRVLHMGVAAPCVGVPDLDQRVADRAAELVEDMAGDLDDLAFGLRPAGRDPGQVVLAELEAGQITHPGHEAAPRRLGDQMQPLARHAPFRRPVGGARQHQPAAVDDQGHRLPSAQLERSSKKGVSPGPRITIVIS